MAENNDIFGESANFLYLEPVEGEEGQAVRYYRGEERSQRECPAQQQHQRRHEE